VPDVPVLRAEVGLFMAEPVSPLTSVVHELGFMPVDGQTAIAEVEGLPAAVTLLSDDPPGLILQWRCRSDGQQVDAVTSLLAGTPESQARMSVENGAVWLSLYDARGQTATTLRQLIAHVAGTIQSTDLALGAGCLKCGAADGAQLMAVEGRPTRLCPDCLTIAVKERQEQESQLNTATVGATLGLPAAIAITTGEWALFWTAIDLVLEWAGLNVIELHQFAILLMLALTGGAGYLLGWPLGAAIRRSVALRHAPIASTLLIVSGVVVGGEIVYLALFVLRRVGIFDLGAAAQFVGPMVANYTAFWIVCKVLVAAAVGVCCALSASARRSAALDV
jgi:hypothetical protein